MYGILGVGLARLGILISLGVFLGVLELARLLA